MTTALVIAGPTASGKSGAALALASVLGGEIVNADAMQVYGDLRILTARPSVEDEAAVAHHLYGVSPGDDPWSAGRFARAAAETVESIGASGRLPIVVGGTGLWLKALTEGLSPIPDVPPEIAAACEARLEDIGMEAFRARVIADDPAMARLDPRDRQRHLRAAAVIEATGTPFSVWQAAPPQPVTDVAFVKTALVPPRELSHQAASARLHGMLEAGAIDEVRALLGKDYNPQLPVMKAVGVPEFAAVLERRQSMEEGIERATASTRQLVKRQTTWLNGQFGDWPRFSSLESLVDWCQDDFANCPPPAA